MKMLICFNGTPSSLHALAYGEWLALHLQIPVHLLGIIEDGALADSVAAGAERVSRSLIPAGITCTREVVEGKAETIIAAHALQEKFLVVVGKLDRPWWRRFLRGRSIRDLLASVVDPMVYVPDAVSKPGLHHLLLCTAGLGYTSDLVSATIPFARIGSMRVTILYVVPPSTYDYPVTAISHVAGWHDLKATHTLIAHNIQSALDTLVAEGIDAEVRVRRGYPAQEIVQEIHEGDYDLIGMGSHYSTTSLRARFTANVTSKVAEQVGRPLLIVRSQPTDDQIE